MNNLTRWAVIVGLCLLSTWLADKRGYERRDAEVRVELERQSGEYEKKLLQMQRDAEQREASIQAQLAQVRTDAARRQASLGAHLREQEANFQLFIQEQRLVSATESEPHDSARPLLGHSVLDAHTVRVLNEARAGGAQDHGDTGPRADEAGRATAVTGTDFALNDLEVVRLYHELAARHNGLVDWVLYQCVDPARQPHNP